MIVSSPPPQSTSPPTYVVPQSKIDLPHVLSFKPLKTHPCPLPIPVSWSLINWSLVLSHNPRNLSFVKSENPWETCHLSCPSIHNRPLTCLVPQSTVDPSLVLSLSPQMTHHLSLNPQPHLSTWLIYCLAPQSKACNLSLKPQKSCHLTWPCKRLLT